MNQMDDDDVMTVPESAFYFFVAAFPFQCHQPYRQAPRARCRIDKRRSRVGFLSIFASRAPRTKLAVFVALLIIFYFSHDLHTLRDIHIRPSYIVHSERGPFLCIAPRWPPPSRVNRVHCTWPLRTVHRSQYTILQEPKH